jgi:hypothetical protein
MRACACAGGEWLDVVRDLQREVAIESGFRSAIGIATAVQRMRTAHVSAPKLSHLSVYARANIAQEGAMQPGDRVPDVPLWSLGGSATTLWDLCGPFTVVCAGSWT